MLNSIKNILGGILSAVRILFFLINLFFVIFFLFMCHFFKLNNDKVAGYFWKSSCFIFGIKIIKDNKISSGNNFVYISNHISYWDQFVYGSLVNPAFIAKIEIKKWPVVGFLSDKFGKTYFIDRRPSQALKEKEKIAAYFKKISKNIMFMPEGTTSDGSSFLPIKGALFENFLEQDVNICLLKIKYFKVSNNIIRTKEMRRIHAWYNDPDPRYENVSLLKSLFTGLSYKSVEIHVKELKVINMKNIKSRHDIVNIITNELEKDLNS